MALRGQGIAAASVGPSLDHEMCWDHLQSDRPCMYALQFLASDFMHERRTTATQVIQLQTALLIHYAGMY